MHGFGGWDLRFRARVKGEWVRERKGEGATERRREGETEGWIYGEMERWKDGEIFFRKMYKLELTI